MITVDDQETFMHSIHDVLKIGISVNNLEYRISHLKEKYKEQNISDILDSKMKDEKYSDELVYPIIKIIYTRPSHINNDTRLIDLYYSNQLIDDKIRDYLRQFDKIVIEI